MAGSRLATPSILAGRMKSKEDLSIFWHMPGTATWGLYSGIVNKQGVWEVGFVTSKGWMAPFLQEGMIGLFE